MAFKPTDAQQAAINARGNILVSAAAGSGKTAVLVERVIKRLTGNPGRVRLSVFFVCDMVFGGYSGKNLREGFEGGTHRKIIYFMCGFGH